MKVFGWPIGLCAVAFAAGGILRWQGAIDQERGGAMKNAQTASFSQIEIETTFPVTPLEQWIEQCRRASIEESAALAETLKANRILRKDPFAWQVVFERWMAASPDAALTFANDHNDHWTMMDSELELVAWQAWGKIEGDAAWSAASDAEQRGAVLHGIALTDPDKAIAWIETLDPSDATMKGALTIISQRDPALAAQLAVGKDHGIMQRAAAEWATKDPLAAWEWAQDHSSSQSGIIKTWMAKDPEEAKKALAALPRSRSRIALTVDASLILAQTQSVSAAITWLESHAGEGERAHALASIARHLATSDREEAIQILEHLGWNPEAAPSPDAYRIGNTSSAGSGVNLKKVMHAVVESAFEENRRNALDLIGRVQDTGTQAGLYGEFIARWATEAPEQTRQWVEALEEPSHRSQAMASLGSAAGKRGDAASLEQTLASMEPLEDRIAYMDGAARAWSRQQADEALAWIDTRPSDEREMVTKHLFDHWMAHDSALAVQQADRIAADPGRLPSFLNAVGSHWGNEDPAAMAAFLSKHDYPSAQWCGFAAYCWMSRDPEAASSWVANMPPSEARDQGASNISRQLFQTQAPDFEAAHAWAQAIENAEQRDALLKDLGSAWWRAAPEQAATAVPEYEPEAPALLAPEAGAYHVETIAH